MGLRGKLVRAVCVDPKEIDKILPHVALFLWEAYRRQPCLDTFGDVVAKLYAGHALLWLAWDGEKILGATVTEIIDRSIGKVCLILACGGKQMKTWIGCLKTIEQYARNEGCSLMHFEGRRGWQRILPDYSTRIILEKKL